MHAALAVAVVAIVFAAIVLCALLPFAIVGLVIWAVVKLVSGGASVVRSAASGDRAAGDATARELGWAAGLLVGGLVWCLGRHFAAILLGLGTSYLTRALLERRREART
jgi:hypothetical protein